MKKGFSGNYIDGVDVDLVKWAGVILTDDEYDKLWGDINEVDLIERCESAIIEPDQEDHDAMPGMSDSYFSVYARDEALMKEELWEQIKRIVTGQQRRDVNVPR